MKIDKELLLNIALDVMPVVLSTLFIFFVFRLIIYSDNGLAVLTTLVLGLLAFFMANIFNIFMGVFLILILVQLIQIKKRFDYMGVYFLSNDNNSCEFKKNMIVRCGRSCKKRVCRNM